jgi:hypothetical protein
MKSIERWQETHLKELTALPEARRSPLWILTGGAVVWLTMRGALAMGGRWATTFGVTSWNDRVRRRVLTGEPVPPGLVKFFGAYGVAGCLVGVALSCKVVEWITWYEPAASQSSQMVYVGLLALFTTVFGAQLAWEALQQSEWETLTAGVEREELAESLLEAEQEEAEEDAEFERTAIQGWPYAVFLAGLLGGVLIMSRLPDAEGGCAFVSSVLAMMWSGCSVHMAKRRLVLWGLRSAALALGVAGLLAYFVLQFEVKTRWALAGLAWGASFGAATATLYLRRLERGSRKGSAARAGRGRGAK